MSRTLLCLLTLLCLFAFPPASAQETGAEGSPSTTRESGEDAKTADGEATAGKEAAGNEEEEEAEEEQKKSLEEKSARAATQAERVAQLKSAIEDDEKALSELQAKLEDPQREFKKAEESLSQVKKQRDAKKEQIEELEEAGKTAEAQALQAELEPLEKTYQLADDRFKIAFEEEKALKEQVGVLKQKIAEEKQSLERLLGTGEEAAAEPAPTPGESAAAQPKEGEAKPSPVSPIPGMPVPTPGASGQETAQAQPPAGEEEPLSAEVVEARKKEAETKAAAEEARKEVRSILETVAAVKKSIELQKQLLATQRKKAENAQATLNALEADLQKKTEEGAPETELSRIREEIETTRQRLQEAREGTEEHTGLLEEKQAELAALQAQQDELVEQKEEAERAAEEATDEVAGLLNPYTPRNILQWLIDHGPRVLVVILCVFLLSRLSAFAAGRMVRVMIRTSSRGSKEERENRAQTLVGVFHNTAATILYGGGALIVLKELSVPVGPLLGGAAIAGVAVAFGAQRLVRDYFHGFVILLENQYGVNDVVRIAGIAGLVERITMRMTVLRDLEGCVHFVPNGEITTVTNMTHGWSRALFDIGVAYKEDADRVMEVLMELGKEIRQDPQFSHLILDDPTMLGLDAMGDSAIVIKFFIKTRPLQQWTVKREMLRRIKRKFDELGIEIPFPHRTVYMRSEEVPTGE